MYYLLIKLIISSLSLVFIISSSVIFSFSKNLAFISNLLMLIPIANIVLVFVWAFGSNVNKSKKTYFQASLIMAGIVLSLYIVIIIILFSFFASNSLRY